MNQVVFHVDEMAKWPLALGNIKNLIQYGKEANLDYQIVIVANSEAVLLLDERKEDVQQDAIPSLLQAQVQIHACQNALRSNHIDASHLLSGIQITPAGVVDLIALQQQGYAYIKP